VFESEKSMRSTALTEAGLSCYNGRGRKVLIRIVEGVLAVTAAMVVDPYVVFTDPKF